MSSESQRSIYEWAVKEFGICFDSMLAFGRASEEATEFLHARDPDEWMAEAADCIITFYWLASILGRDMNDEVDRKMAINRSRRWLAHGDGTGHHTKD